MSYLLLLSLINMVICAFPTTIQNKAPASIQETPSALETYAKIRKKALSRFPDGEATPHYSIAAVSQRLDDTQARIDFAVAGEMTGFTFTLQPINIRKRNNNLTTQERAGEMLTMSQIVPTQGHSHDRIAEPSVIVPISKDANAIEVVWTPKNTTGEVSFTLVLPLENIPSANGFVAVGPPQKISATPSSK